jgi:hypothetical protein
MITPRPSMIWGDIAPHLSVEIGSERSKQPT